jgi:hypothetical protein
MDTITKAGNGTFSDQLSSSTAPLAAGTWQIQAAYAGDSTHGPASAAQSVAVR